MSQVDGLSYFTQMCNLTPRISRKQKLWPTHKTMLDSLNIRPSLGHHTYVPSCNASLCLYNKQQWPSVSNKRGSETFWIFLRLPTLKCPLSCTKKWKLQRVLSCFLLQFLTMSGSLLLCKWREITLTWWLSDAKIVYY